MANFSQNLVFNGLGTFAFNYPNTEVCFVEGKLSLPSLSQGSTQSSVVVVVKQAGVTKYTGIAGAEGFYVNLNCTANDLIEIVLSSAVAGDNLLNVIKTNISYGSGE